MMGATSTTSLTMHPRLNEEDYDDENSMPFAVDTSDMPGDNSERGSTSGSAMAGGGLSSGTPSMILRDMISHPPKHRLKLFESGIAEPSSAAPSSDTKNLTTEPRMDDDFASQLAEFKTFGESLLVQSSTMASQSQQMAKQAATGPSSTPISLQT